MTGKQITPYGSWPSPLTADAIAAGSTRLGQCAVHHGEVFWLEGRPAEGGRNVLTAWNETDGIRDVLPPEYNVRTRAHEYGSGAFRIEGDSVYFVHDGDQRIHRAKLKGGVPEPVTPEGDFRYADFAVDGRRNRLICVREDHRLKDENTEERNELVSIDLVGGDITVVASGADFYSNPRLAPDGSSIAWIQWNHPNMPWDANELFVADMNEDGTVRNAAKVAGGERESIFQPGWSPDGVLYFVSDQADWWNFYRLIESDDGTSRVERVLEYEADFGRTQWIFDMSLWGFISNEKILCARLARGEWQLGEIDITTDTLREIQAPWVDISDLRVADGMAAIVGGTPDKPAFVSRFDPSTGEVVEIRASAELKLNPDDISRARHIDFPTANGEIAYAFLYEPRNSEHQAADGTRPPLIVKSHGGPTHAANGALKLDIQFWTTRGFAVLDVNYRGSNGYGRAYREALEGRWGVADVEDCALGAAALVERGLVDGERMAITGGSAGGYTTLCALTFRDEFRAGASHYGISDLEALARDTHKFEARYLDRLVGPYPEAKDRYRERSPVHYAEQLNCPVIFFQGLEDKVVPPNQAEMMVDALDKKGLAAAYVTFEGEQHGFRRAENIKRALEGELYFYARVFGFETADEIEPVEIRNLDQ